jgi:Fe-S-cluster-containing dehydrogenase component
MKKTEVNLKESPFLLPSKGYLVYDPQLCTGCHVCEAICSFVKENGRVQPSVSRIQVHTNPFGGTIENYMPKPCLHCETPQCMIACPIEKAMYIDKETGGRVINQELCISCGACMRECGKYFDPPRIIFHPEKHIYVKCDLCGGKPECAKWCPNGALKYMKRSDFVEKGKKYRLNFVEAFEKDFGPTIKPFEGPKWRYTGSWLKED